MPPEEIDGSGDGRGRNSQAEDGALAVGPAPGGCPIEIPVGSLNQHGLGVRAIVPVKLYSLGKLTNSVTAVQDGADL